ncbi:MAG: helix-turn-helix transcriptional regulator [Paludibacteraceae bacterium]|nr:helix-turn-helix transcriptional regulator [Paludibacteraceae bacterium]
MESVAGEWSYAVVNLCVYPLYYAYLRALVRAPVGGEVPVLLVPPVAVAILYPLCRWGGVMDHDSLSLICRMCFAVQVVWVLVRGYQLVHTTIRHMDNTYSDDRSYLLRPVHLWLILFAVTAAVSMVLNFFGREYFTHDTILLVPAVVMSVLLFGLGFIAAHTTLPAEAADDSSPTAANEEESPDELIRRIDATMREQMLYKRPGLTIYDLAKLLNSNRTYISSAINRTYGVSFSHYVARQRVEYAKMILGDTRYTTDKAAVADAIALSGFASEQTFYRVFKQHTSLTPLAFRKAQTGIN